MTLAPPELVKITTSVVYLLHATSATETRLLEEWVAENQPGDEARDNVVHLAGFVPGRADRIDAGLSARLARGDDPLLVPLRVAWLPKERGGKRTTRLRDLIATGDPRR